MRRSSARSSVFAILALGTLLSDSSALADDYSLDFGVKTDAGKDAGTLSCRFGEICAATLELLRLRVSIDVFRGESERASVRLDGDDLSCCYFDGAADSIAIDSRLPLSRVPLFKGT